MNTIRFALSIMFLTLSASAAAAFRPPAVPLVSCDPFFSVWSVADTLTERETTNWGGAKQPISITLTADGKTWRLCGLEPQSVPALPQTSVKVMPLQTTYTFKGEGLIVSLIFSTAKLVDDLDVFSRPVTYVTARVEGAKEWRLDAAISPAIATNDDKAQMVTNRCTVAGLPALSIGRKEQRPLAYSGNRVRCDWGYAWLVGPSAAKEGEAHFILAYDDVKAMQFFGDDLPAWWRRDGLSFAAMLEKTVAERPAILKRLDAFDAELYADLVKVGGEKYAAPASRAYRQTFAACKLVADRNNQPLYFSKEQNSNGCIGTVDTLCPLSPQMLFASPTLMRAMLAPVLLSEKGKGDVRRMPGKAYCDMIICLAALARAEGTAEFSSCWWPTVTKWAEFIAHNASKSEKSKVALACYGRLAGALGHSDVAAKYAAIMKDTKPKLMKLFKDGVFMPMLSDKAMWRKYASRDKAKTGIYAPLTAAGSCGEEDAFNLASFNIRCPSPSDTGVHFWANRFPYVVKVINDRAFDIVGMQELAPRQRKFLDEALGAGWGRVGIGREPHDKGESMTIYYRKDRFECLGDDTFWLSETPRVPGSKSWNSSCPRSCTWGLFRDKRTGRTFRYYNTHLDHKSNEARVKGMRIILAEMRRLSQGETVFLTGDMNAHYKDVSESDRARLEAGGGPVVDDPETIDGPIAAALHSLYDTRFRSETPHEGPIFTFSGYRPNNVCLIDFVFATGNVRVLRHVTCHERPDGMHPSDHDAVMARMVIR